MWEQLNQNEPFSSTIWQGCPKTEFCSATTVEIAVNLAVISLNAGQVPFAAPPGMAWGPSFSTYHAVPFFQGPSPGVCISDEGRITGEEKEAGFASGQGDTGGAASGGRGGDVWCWEILRVFSLVFFTGFFQSHHLPKGFTFNMCVCVCSVSVGKQLATAFS